MYKNPLTSWLDNFIPLEDANQLQLGMGCAGMSLAKIQNKCLELA